MGTLIYLIFYVTVKFGKLGSHWKRSTY